MVATAGFQSHCSNPDWPRMKFSAVLCWNKKFMENEGDGRATCPLWKGTVLLSEMRNVSTSFVLK